MPDLASLRLVLIEDNEADARLIEHTLAEAGGPQPQLHWEQDLAAGLAHVQEQGADLLLLDLSLPDANGLDGVQRARAELPRVPVVVLTGLDDERTAEQALQEGAQDYLVKGQHDAATLMRTIRYAVERAAARAALQASERRFRTLVERNADGVLVLDATGAIRFANPAAARILATEVHALEGERLDHEVPVDGVTELEFKRPDGHAVIVEGHAAAIEWSDAPATLVSLRDVTGEVEADREIDRLRQQLAMSETLSTLGALVSSMGPELSAATTTITNQLYEARQEIEARARRDPAFHELLEAFADQSLVVMDQVARIDRLVENLRRLSQTQPGHRVHRSLDETIEPTLDLFRHAHRHHIDLEADLDAPSPLELNDLQVQQVVNALLENAAEAMPGGGTVRLTTQEVAGGVELAVQDEGAGVQDYVAARLFEPFFTTKRDATGLGLAVSRRVVEAHGGTITLDPSTRGQGARFVVFLPGPGAREDEGAREPSRDA